MLIIDLTYKTSIENTATVRGIPRVTGNSLHCKKNRHEVEEKARRYRLST